MLHLRYNNKQGILYNDFTERYMIMQEKSVAIIDRIVNNKELKYSKENTLIVKKLIELTIFRIEGNRLLINNSVNLNKIQGEVYRYPFVAYWLITNKCNFKCKHCCWGAHSKLENELSVEESEQLIDGLVDIGVVRLSISGGEPLCEYERLIKSIKYAKSKGIDSICIATNGSLLTDEKIKELVESGVTDIQFSIDDNNKNIHNLQRAKNSYEKILHNVQELRKYNVMVSAGLTLHKMNAPKVDKIVDSIIKEFGINKIKIVRFLPIVKDKYSLQYEMSDSKEIADIISKLTEIESKYRTQGVSIKLPAVMQVIRRYNNDMELMMRSCEALILRMCIKSNGDYSPCPIMSSLGVLVGNCREMAPKKMIDSKQARDIVEFEKKECKSECEYYKYCGGGCLANSLNYQNDYEAKDVWCFKEYRKYL